MNSDVRPGIVLAVLGTFALLALFVFWPAVSGPFVFDDAYQFFAAPQLPAAAPATYLLGARPVLQVSFYWNHLWAQDNAASYHIVNILLHAANATLAGLVIFLLLRLANPENTRNGIAAILAGGLFLLHPIQTEGVCYISSRSDLLSSFFFLSAFAGYLHLRPKGIGWLSALLISILFGLALGSKEIAIALPAIFLVVEWLFRDRLTSLVQGGAWRLYVILTIGALAGAAVIFRYISADTELTIGPSLPYFFTQWRALARYLQLLIWPAGLTLDYDFPLSQTPTDHGALISLLVVIVVIGLAVWLRDRHGLVLLGLAILVLVLAPTTSIIPIPDPIAERRMYLPMLGVALIAGTAIANWKEKSGIWIGAGTLAVLAFISYQRAVVWGDAVTLWRDTAENSPKKFRPQFWLGQALLQRRNCPAASVELEKARSLAAQPDAELETFRAFAFACSNQPSRAADAMTEALAIKGEDDQKLALRATYLASSEKIGAAKADLERALQLNPDSVPALSTRGKLHLIEGRPAEAVADLERAAALAPGDTQILTALSQAKSMLVQQQSSGAPR